MAKQNIYNKASVLKDTNRVVCESRFNPSYLRSGSRIKFDLDPECYTIARHEELFYIAAFETTIDGNLLIKENVDINLTLEDNLDISYKEYELDPNVSFLNHGAGYLVGDVLTIKEGTPYTDPDSKIDRYSRLEVAEINSTGGVTLLKLIDVGRYVETPTEQVSFGYEPPGGNGSGLELVLIYKTINNRAIINREVFGVSKRGADYVIKLNYALPSYIKAGKLAVYKYQLFLSSPYASESKLSSTYKLITDFTENYKLPYLIENSLSAATVYNETLTVLDAKLKAMEDKIAKLEARG